MPALACVVLIVGSVLAQRSGFAFAPLDIAVAGGLLIGAMLLLPLARYVCARLAPAARVVAGVPPHIPHRLNARRV